MEAAVGTHTLTIRSAVTIWILYLLAAPVSGQPAPRTAWGDPDLQGIFTFATITPLERPNEVGGKEVLTEEEARSLEERTARERIDRPPRPGDTGTYNRFWVDYGTQVVGTNRTSLITDEDGTLPPLAPPALERNTIQRAAGSQPPGGPEDLTVTDRCILGFNSGPPFLPSAYNNTVQLFQTPDYVVILNEMIHDARFVPLGGRPHLDPRVRQWMGDSRGRWEGDTLVVETTNFDSNRELMRGVNLWRYTNAHGHEGTAHLVERFTRLDANTVSYSFTLNDPGTWTRPWSASFPLVGIDGELFEYACHEGNYSMANILSGARAHESR
jgi:hypothetical protein